MNGKENIVIDKILISPESKKSRQDKIEDFLIEDWKECQNSIRLFDKFIYNLRRYGFTLITGLLTAEFLLEVPNKELREIIPISMSTMILIVALFIFDIYYDSLLRGAVRRAVDIEKRVPVNICFHISASAEKAGTNTAGIFIYLPFIVVSTIPLWFTQFSENLLKDLIHFLLILLPIVAIIYALIRIIRENADIGFDIQCDRNAKAIELEYCGKIEEAQKLYQKNVDENYIGDFSYLRLAEILREKNEIKKEIEVLDKFINNINKIFGNWFWRPDKKSKLNHFEKRKEFALKIEPYIGPDTSITGAIINVKEKMKKHKKNTKECSELEEIEKYFIERLNEPIIIKLLLERKNQIEDEIKYYNKMIQEITQELEKKQDVNIDDLKELRNNLKVIKQIKNLITELEK